MYKKITLFLLCTIGLANIMLSQTITLSGKVLDKENQPIEFANILLQKSDQETVQNGTITNQDGRFKLAVSEKGKYKLTISFVGFEDVNRELIINQSIDLQDVTLLNSVNELSEVVIKGARNIITRKEDKLVFNVATSPLSTGYDGVEVLQRSPNVIVDTEGNILMRNQAPTVMINGRITNLSGADLANYLSNIQSENIKSIEIQTHQSANTDGESSGGIINVILKKKPKGFVGNVRGNYSIKGGGFENGYAGTNFNYGAEKWNIYGLYNYSYNSSESIVYNQTEYFETDDLFATNSVYESYFNRNNYQLGFVGDLAKNHTIGLEGYATNSEYDFINNGLVKFYNSENLLDDGTALATGTTDADLYNLTFNYGWTIDTSKSNLKFYADYAHQDVARSNTATSTYTNGLYADNSERNIAPAKTVIFSLQTDLEKYFRNGWKLETGAKLTHTDRSNTLFSDILLNETWEPTGRSTDYDYAEQVIAGYAAINKNIGKKSFVELGLRVENTDLERLERGDNSTIQQNYTNWFPNIYFSQDLKNDHTLSLSFSKKLRRPPFQFLNNNVIKINDFRYELGNPDLIPESFNGWELSWKSKNQSVEFYVDRVNDAINGIYFLEGQIAYYQKFNEGVQQQIGVTYNRYGNLTKWWYIKALVSIYNRKFINEGGNDSFKRTTARLNISNNFKLNKTTSIDLIGRYISPSEDAYYIAYERFRVDLMFQKTFFNRKLITRIYLNDFLNLLEYGAERPFDNFRTFRQEKWRSRTFRVWVSYNFNGKNKVNQRKNKSKNEARRRL